MAKFFSKTTMGFYSLEINPVMPDDVVYVPDSTYDAIFANMTNGQVLSVDGSGNPITVSPPPPTAAQLALAAAAAALAQPVNVTSASNNALNGAYPVTPTVQANLNATSTYIAINSKFPGSLSAMPWTDAEGNVHLFETTSAFQQFATAMADYISAIAIYADTAGAHGSIPSNTISIP